MIRKYAAMMQLPEGKKPGYYAQIIKSLANKINLFDRDKEILIVNAEEELATVYEVLDHFHVDHEPIRLILLPENTELPASIEEYGFTSRSENTYLYEQWTAIFNFVPNQTADAGEKGLALRQMEEHLLLQFQEGQDTFYVTQHHLQELIHGIAKAYHCKVEFRY